jgi:hypothetical protein
MTMDETARLLAVTRARYPLSKLWDQPAELTLQGWYRVLADCPYAQTDAALDEWMRTETWAPDPAELRDAVATRVLGIPGPEEAWDMALAAIHGYYPGHDNSWISLPDAVRNAVRSIGGLHNLKMSEDVQGDREAFLRVYAVERRRIVATAVLDHPELGTDVLARLGAGVQA